MKTRFGGPVIANESYTPEHAEAVLGAGEADAVSWGKQYIANPDLVERLKRGGPFNEPNPATFYAPGAQGYTDYPFLKDEAK
jgi:2,4-dienoyl-CoA reductase-like NADH-dependent reductase (Old Yellow Enzyme family)